MLETQVEPWAFRVKSRIRQQDTQKSFGLIVLETAAGLGSHFYFRWYNMVKLRFLCKQRHDISVEFNSVELKNLFSWC